MVLLRVQLPRKPNLVLALQDGVQSVEITEKSLSFIEIFREINSLLVTS